MRPHRLCLAVLLTTCSTLSVRADIITDWNNAALQAIRTGGTPPPMASRNLAMTHIAMFDAVNAVNRKYQSYFYNPLADPTTNQIAAAAQSAHDVLKALYPAQAATFDALLTTSLSTIADGSAKTNGIALGAAVGAGMLALRSGDGSVNMLPPYLGGTDPGMWRPTPAGFAAGLLPNWPNVTPFAMTSGSQFRLGPPPALTSAEYAADFNEVKEIGSAGSAVRTADQTDIARFWADGGGTSTPPGHWNRIAQTVTAGQGLSLEENARLFALMNISMADAAIAVWDMKYEYELWRPVTAIRLADTDGNPDTEADPTWSSLIATPPFPTYTSGHSAFSIAAADILAALLGTDNIAFTSSAEGFMVGDRSFTSFSQAAEEAAMSRIYGGIHFRFDNTVSQTMGRSIAAYAMANRLAPVPEPGSAALLFGFGTACFAVLRRRR